MRRGTLNGLAGIVILAGGLFLSAGSARAATCDGPAGSGGCTCTSGDGNYTCTGDSCTSSSTGCTSKDKAVALQVAPEA